EGDDALGDVQRHPRVPLRRPGGLHGNRGDPTSDHGIRAMNRALLLAVPLALQQQPGQVKFPVALELGRASSRSGVPGPGGMVPVRPAPGSEPKLTFDRVMHEFGEVAEGPEFPSEFRFKNEGKGDLRILAEYHHCGCTLPRIETDGKPYVWGDPL